MGEQKKQTRDSHKNNNSKYSSVSTKPSVIKDLNKEIDLDFLPKDVLYNEKTFDESNKNILAAIEILEKANENKREIDQDVRGGRGFWDKFSNFWNPFKCGHADN